MNYDSSASAAFSTEFIVHIHSSKKSKRYRRAVAVIETGPVVDGSAFLVTAAWTGADHEVAQNSAEAAAILRQLAVPGGLLSGLCADRTNEAPSSSEARAEQSAAGGATRNLSIYLSIYLRLPRLDAPPHTVPSLSTPAAAISQTTTHMHGHHEATMGLAGVSLGRELRALALSHTASVRRGTA
eukprot:scaffold13757_cov73-Phaeocystis_antarctica.AAC.1